MAKAVGRDGAAPEAGSRRIHRNNDTKANNSNSRIIFTPKEDAVYRIVATSFEQRGVGEYQIMVREFAGKK